MALEAKESELLAVAKRGDAQKTWKEVRSKTKLIRTSSGSAAQSGER